MRKEADDSGPLTELEHWKRMSAKFNYIIEQIKGSSCKAVINVLNVAHSKLLKVKGLRLLTWKYFRTPYQKITLTKRLLKVWARILCVYHIDIAPQRPGCWITCSWSYRQLWATWHRSWGPDSEQQTQWTAELSLCPPPHSLNRWGWLVSEPQIFAWLWHPNSGMTCVPPHPAF